MTRQVNFYNVCLFRWNILFLLICVALCIFNIFIQQLLFFFFFKSSPSSSTTLLPCLVYLLCRVESFFFLRVFRVSICKLMFSKLFLLIFSKLFWRCWNINGNLHFHTWTSWDLFSPSLCMYVFFNRSLFDLDTLFEDFVSSLSICRFVLQSNSVGIFFICCKLNRVFR